MDSPADNRSLMRRRGGTGWRRTRRVRGFTSGDDMKTNGCFVAGQQSVEHKGGNFDAKVLVVEFHFAVAGEDAVSTQCRVHRNGHRVRFAVKSQVAGDDRGAFGGAGHDDADDAAALESNGGIFVSLERFFGYVSIA